MRNEIQELRKALKQEQINLSQEQHLHANSIKQLEETRNQIQLLEHRRPAELDHMIGMLERTRDSFVKNAELINQFPKMTGSEATAYAS